MKRLTYSYLKKEIEETIAPDRTLNYKKLVKDSYTSDLTQEQRWELLDLIEKKWEENTQRRLEKRQKPKKELTWQQKQMHLRLAGIDPFQMSREQIHFEYNERENTPLMKEVIKFMKER